MIDIQLDLNSIYGFVPESSINLMEDEVIEHFQDLFQGIGRGKEFLGWLTLPSDIPDELVKKIDKEAKRIQQIAEVFVVVGIGGSYLGARAVIEALSPAFHSLGRGRRYPLVVYAGHHLSQDYLADLLKLLDLKDYALAVISKSGTTTEPAIAFRILREHIEKKYGKAGARQRIIAITDRQKGALKKLSEQEGYSTYAVPDDVGGRYSVLTPVGLLPIAVAGYDIKKLIGGAQKMQDYTFVNPSLKENPVTSYAAARNALYRSGKTIEIMVNYQPQLHYFTEWWKQLYGESEGKQNKGIFPAGVSFTTDLHSMGQYVQDGMRNLFETAITVKKTRKKIIIPKTEDDSDGLNYLAGKDMQFVNQMAEIGTRLAHVEGGVPNIIVGIPRINEDTLGQMIYFFEVACGLSGYILGVNPFDQPGVEAYKKNMFALLGKPGYEEETERIRKRI
jgi:glucose-6-phosphate isomerase